VDASGQTPGDKPEFTIKRIFNAPRDLVFLVWTRPQYVSQWWGVEGCTIVCCELDVRSGGSFTINMRTADGTIYKNRGIYTDVRVNERIEYRDERDAGAAPGPIPLGRHVVTFQDADGKTLVTLTSIFQSVQDRDLMVRFGVLEGIRQSLDRLERLLQNHINDQSSYVRKDNENDTVS
jgi:uncharacterized protein YndB with AHSA1/START domain